MDIIFGQWSINLDIEWIGKHFRRGYNSFDAKNTIGDENEEVSKKIIISYHDTTSTIKGSKPQDLWLVTVNYIKGQ